MNAEPVLILGGFAFLAGLMDAIAGGGGLILVPALFAVFPNASPALLLGTNKLTSIAGTFVATVRYGFSVPIDWKRLVPAALCAAAGALAGAKTVTLLDPSVLRPAIVVLLVLVAGYTLLRPGLGVASKSTAVVYRPDWLLPALAALAGFYDGFFGPGAGSLMIFGLVRWFSYDFLRAAAAAKVLNFSTNLGATVLFAATGNIMYLVAIPLAGCSIAGALIGSHLAIRKGAPLIRIAFLLVVLALIAKVCWDWLR